MRSISAKVTADVSVLKREMGRGGDEVDKFGRRVKSTSRQANADLEAIGVQAAKLADQIRTTGKAVDDLGFAFAKTGDTTLLKQREQQQKLLADLKKAQSLVFDVQRSRDDGGKAGNAFAKAMRNAVASAGDIVGTASEALSKGLPTEVKIAILAGVAAAVPFVTSAVAGAIAAGATSAGIGGGIAIAMQDPKIKKAAGAVGDEILTSLRRSAGGFGPAVEDSLSVVRDTFRDLEGEFDSIFANSSNQLVPLTRHLADGIGMVVEALDRMIASAGPSMDAVGMGIENVLGEVGALFDTIAEDPETAGRALSDLFFIFDTGVRQVRILVDAFLWLYDTMIDLMPYLDLVQTFLAGPGWGEHYADGTAKAGENTNRLTREIEGAVDATQALNDAFDSLFGRLMGLDEAQLAYAEGQKKLNEELGKGARSLSANSTEGQKNASAILDQVQKIERLRDARVKHGESLDSANGKYQTEIDGLMRTAVAAGFSAKAVEKLVGKYRAVPDTVDTTVTVDGVPVAKKKVDTVRDALQGLPDGSATVNVNTWGAEVKLAQLRANITNLGGTYIAPPKTRKKARGGVDIAMAAGGTLEAGIYPASNPPLVKFAEAETGGELYLPRLGDRARGRQLVTEAAEWYDMTAVPMRAGGVLHMAGGGLVNVQRASSSDTTSTRLDSVRAALDAYDAVSALNRSLKENGRAFSIATTKGRENRAAVLAGVSAARDAARAKFEETGSITAANKVYDEYIKRLGRTLKAQKASTSLLTSVARRPSYDTGSPKNSAATIAYAQARMDLATAQEKAASFFDPSWGKPKFDTSSSFGRDNLTALFEFLSAAEAQAQARFRAGASASVATATYNSSLGALRTILTRAGLSKIEIDSLLTSYGRITLSNRWGGVYQHAREGVLRDAHIAAGGPTRYAYAEAATGGELFAPKNGDLAKTRAEVGWAVQNWWGGDVRWQGAGQASARPAPVAGGLSIRVIVDDGAVAGLVRVEVDEAFGDLAQASVYATS